MIGVQAFCFLQYENFLSGYPLCQMLGQFLVVATVAVLTRGEVSTRRLLAAAGLAIAASLCWGAAVAAFVVGALILVARRAGPFRFVLWCGLATPALLLARSASSGAVLTDWKSVPSFFFVLVGRPWVLGPEWSTRSSLVLGCLACGVFSAVAWSLRNRADFAPWIGLGLFSMGSSGLVALARSGSGLDQALASHYITANYPLLLACVAGLVLLLCEARFAGRQVVIGAIVIGSIGQAVWVSSRVHTQLAGWSGLMRRIASEIAWGTVSDADILRAHHPQVELVRRGAEVLRRRRLSWFADWPKNAPAGNFGNVDEPTDLARTGWRVDRPLRMAGWAVDADWGTPVQAVELWLDDRLAGSAQVGLVRTDVVAYFDHPKALRSGWVLDLPPIAPGVEAAGTPGVHRARLTVVDPSGARRNLWQGQLRLARTGDGELTP